MELTPGIVIVAVVVAAVTFVLIRWAFRHEAAAPAEPSRAPVKSSAIVSRDERGSDPLVNWLLDRALEQTGIDVADDTLARDRIVQAAAKASEDLRVNQSATISLPFLIADAQGPRHFDVRFTRRGSSFELEP